MPITDWLDDLVDAPGDQYEILLTGAQAATVATIIPEPSTLTAMLMLFSFAAAYQRRMGSRRKADA